LCADDLLYPDCEAANAKKLAELQTKSRIPIAPAVLTSSTDRSSTAVQLVVASVFASRNAGAQKVILNKLLAYVNLYRHNSTVEALQKVVLLHFSHEDIAEAKRLFVFELHSVDGFSQFTTERRNSSARPAHEAEIDDIINMLDIADTKQALDGYLFVACNFSVMP